MKKVLIIFLFGIMPMIANAAVYAYKAGVGLSLAWQFDDTIALFTDGGARIKMWAINNNGNNTEFSAYGFGLEQNYPFTAYYPLTSASGSAPATFLPMTYTGQKQVQNDNASHLALYDYMQTQRTYSTTSSLHLNFQHLGAVIRYEITMPEASTLTSITLNATNSVTLALDNIAVAEGGKLIAYMMVPAMQFTDGKATLTVKNNQGGTATINLTGKSILAGKCYPVSLTCPEFVTTSRAKTAEAAAKTVSAADNAKPTGMGEQSIIYPTAYAPDFLIDTANPIEEEVAGIVGDVNGDGKVMVNDAVLLVNYYLADKLQELDKKICDVNGDGIVSVADAVAIVNIYLRSE